MKYVRLTSSKGREGNVLLRKRNTFISKFIFQQTSDAQTKSQDVDRNGATYCIRAHGKPSNMFRILGFSSGKKSKKATQTLSKRHFQILQSTECLWLFAREYSLRCLGPNPSCHVEGIVCSLYHLLPTPLQTPHLIEQHWKMI